jgi:hypothetical protein
MTKRLNQEQSIFGVAENLRNLAATQLRYDIRRRDQLLALAAGFERFADRLEIEAAAAD